MDLSRRSYQKELLDGENIPFADIAINMQELDFINANLGGHAITISGLRKLLKGQKENKTELLVCEIGCGGGDNLEVISEWCRSKNIRVEIIGIDKNPECIEFARSKGKILNANWISSDYRLVHLSNKPDIIFSSLFCHHFNDEQVVNIFEWMSQNSKMGFFVNDLHRNVLAFYSIKLLTKLFSNSYLVKNDAPLSVARGFKRSELEKFLKVANINNYNIGWKWAFRWLLTSNHR
jgi:2-polyprenyl-3-methyl-5-hydroxy-6-metoxy-1,4-benzoquinol methylase